MVDSRGNESNYRWYVLTLAALTFTFVCAAPIICMTVLFKEISNDLGLSLVQMGTIWGMPNLAALFVVFLGGLLADRFGARRVLGTTCLLAGLAGAMRGLTGDFTSLAVVTFFVGITTWIIPASIFKTTATWFSRRRLVLANGVVSTGMGLGFTIGAMISATVLSPLLGGWENVLFLYGGISAMIGLLWFLTVRESEQPGSAGSGSGVPLRQSISNVFPNKAVWLIGLALLGYAACVQGMIGYLPTYLRDMGWTAASADGTLAAFNGVSMLGAIPLALLSQKLGLRKVVLFPVLFVTIVGIALLPVVNDAMLWVLMIVVGVARDGFFAICLTMSTESKGIGVVYAGTAMGLAQTIVNVGNVISPPLGNSLAGADPGFPFFFWAAFAFLGLVVFYFVKETGRRRHPDL